MKDIIKQLEDERDVLEQKQIKLQRIIDDLKELHGEEKITEKIDHRKYPNHVRKKRGRLTNSETQEKKAMVEELLKEGKLTKGEIAEKVGVHKSCIYNWFDVSKYPKKDADHSEIAKKAYKKKWGDKHPADNRKRKHMCENCNENVWSAWWNGKQLCKRCFDLKKKGESAVLRKEKKDPGAYDPSDLEIDDFEEDENE